MTNDPSHVPVRCPMPRPLPRPLAAPIQGSTRVAAPVMNIRVHGVCDARSLVQLSGGSGWASVPRRSVHLGPLPL